MNWGTTPLIAGDAKVSVYFADPCRRTLPAVSMSSSYDSVDSSTTAGSVPDVDYSYFTIRNSGGTQVYRWTAMCS